MNLEGTSGDGATGLFAATGGGDLQDQLSALRDELARVRLTAEARPAVRQLYVPKERKVRPFSGREGELTVTEFITDMESLFRARAMTDDEQCDFITSHLEGDARREIRYRSTAELTTPRRLMNVLLDVFGEKRSVSQLQELFYLRKQAEGETIRKYSGALQELMEALLLKEAHAVNQPDRVLAEHFAEGLRDRVLRREVKQQLRRTPGRLFADVREEAIQWSEEEEERPPGSRRQAVNSRELVATSAEQGNHQFDERVISSEDTLQRVLAALEHQQQVIGGLVDRVDRMEGAVAGDSRGRQTRQRPTQGRQPLRFTDDGVPICYRCDQTGHIGRECPGVGRTDQAQRRPDTRPPGDQRRPDTRPPGDQRRPDTRPPSDQRRPDSRPPSDQRRPDTRPTRGRPQPTYQSEERASANALN